MRVLLVDDDVAFSDALKDYLQDSGHEVLAAHNGREALDRLTGGFRANVIILDLFMPEMDGSKFRAAQRLDPAIADIPVIVLSGADLIDPSVLRELSVTDYIPKPLNPETLRSMLGGPSETPVKGPPP